MQRFVLLLLLCVPRMLWAAYCTDGTDCFCDQSGHKPGDTTSQSSTVLMCEDWEAPNLYADTGNGNGAPNYGPWYDKTGGPTACYRGYNQYWIKKYGVLDIPSDGMYAWNSGQPASPTVGCTCITGSASCVAGAGDYRADDKYQVIGPTGGARLDVIANASEANEENSALGIPDTNGTNDNVGIFDGNQMLGFRVPTAQSGGRHGMIDLGSNGASHRTSLGMTFAMAYSDNVVASGIMAQPWKHWEAQGNAGAGLDYSWPVMGGNIGDSTKIPLMGHLRGPLGVSGEGSFSQSACDTSCSTANAASGHIGTCNCIDVLGYSFIPAGYTQSSDWPYGDFGIVMAKITGLGSSTNGTMDLWFCKTPGGTQTQLVHLFGLNYGNTVVANSYWDAIAWNNHVNANQDPGCTSTCETPTTAPVRRWMDDIIITDGNPVPCSELGTGGGATPRRRVQGPMLLDLFYDLFHLRQYRHAWTNEGAAWDWVRATAPRGH